jgi:hypothetical protein
MLAIRARVDHLLDLLGAYRRRRHAGTASGTDRAAVEVAAWDAYRAALDAPPHNVRSLEVFLCYLRREVPDGRFPPVRSR